MHCSTITGLLNILVLSAFQLLKIFLQALYVVRRQRKKTQMHGTAIHRLRNDVLSKMRQQRETLSYEIRLVHFFVILNSDSDSPGDERFNMYYSWMAFKIKIILFLNLICEQCSH